MLDPILGVPIGKGGGSPRLVGAAQPSAEQNK